MKKLKITIYKIFKMIGILPYAVSVQTIKNLLIDLGHLRSSTKQQSIDKNGEPIPWFSYPAIEYLRSLDLSNKIIFEYGSGNSTAFWSKISKQIISTENDLDWYKKLSENMEISKNLTGLYRPIKSDYINAINENNNKYDIVVIDGKYRNLCSHEAIKKLRPGGMIILDNSDWFPQICRFLRSKKLIEIDFTGFGPINPYTTTTSLFIKSEFNPQFVNHIKHPGSIPLIP